MTWKFLFDPRTRYLLYIKKGVLLTEVTTTMASLLSELGTVVTETLSWTVEAVDTIVGSPFLLLTTGILVLGGAIGILGRLLSRG